MLNLQMFPWDRAGGFGKASPRLHLPVPAASAASGSAGGGEEAAGVRQAERGAPQPARGSGAAAEACRYSTHGGRGGRRVDIKNKPAF